MEAGLSSPRVGGVCSDVGRREKMGWKVGKRNGGGGGLTPQGYS